MPGGGLALDSQQQLGEKNIGIKVLPHTQEVGIQACLQGQKGQERVAIWKVLRDTWCQMMVILRMVGLLTSHTLYPEDRAESHLPVLHMNCSLLPEQKEPKEQSD